MLTQYRHDLTFLLTIRSLSSVTSNNLSYQTQQSNKGTINKMRWLNEPLPNRKILTGKNKPRSKTGCLTCRRRRIKCDEGKPVCQKCTRRDLTCEFPSIGAKRTNPVKFRPIISRTEKEKSVETRESRETTTSLFWALSPAEKISAERRKTFFDFLDSGPFCDDGEVHRFIEDFWPIPWNREDAECIHELTRTFTVSATKSYKYCFHALLMYISTLNKILAQLLFAMALGHVKKRTKASDNYQSAVADLTVHIQNMSNASSNGDAFIALAGLWLAIQYEIQYSGNTELLERHLFVFSSLIQGGKNCAPLLQEFCEPTESFLLDEYIPAAVSAKLILWTTYHDTICYTFGVGGKLSVLVTRGPIDGMKLLHDRSQETNQEMWQEFYPFEEMFDDVVNRDILQLHHHSLILRLKVSELQNKWLDGDFDDFLAFNIEEYLESIIQAFPDPLADDESSPALLNGRYSSNVNTLSCYFLGPRLLFTVLVLEASSQNKTALDTANFYSTKIRIIRDILYLCCKIEEEESSDALVRVLWPMFLCALESDDVIYQSWIAKHFQNLRSGRKNVENACQVVSEFRGKGILSYVRSSYSGSFVI